MSPYPSITLLEPLFDDPTFTLKLGSVNVGEWGALGITGGLTNLGSKVGNSISGGVGAVLGDFLLITLGLMPAFSSNDTIGSFWDILLAMP